MAISSHVRHLWRVWHVYKLAHIIIIMRCVWFNQKTRTISSFNNFPILNYFPLLTNPPNPGWGLVKGCRRVGGLHPTPSPQPPTSNPQPHVIWDCAQCRSSLHKVRRVRPIGWLCLVREPKADEEQGFSRNCNFKVIPREEDAFARYFTEHYASGEEGVGTSGFCGCVIQPPCSVKCVTDHSI